MSISRCVALALASCSIAFGLADVASAQTQVRTKRIVTGLSFPTFVTHAPGDTERLFVTQKGGSVRIIDLTTNTLLPGNFLTVSVAGGTTTNDERGLLGLAFHPNYAENGYLFVNYTASGSGATRVSRFSVDPNNPNQVLPGSELVLLTIAQPFTNHNGGWIGFGPDGYLYIATGDGGSANDPGNRAQTITNQLLGKMLRIDPNVAGNSPTYFIPSDNPFVGVTGDDEIWAYGLRNPWRCSFDRATGDLWIADVGQNQREEVNFQPAGIAGGRNYGWRCKEGLLCTGLTGCTCSSPLLTDPIYTYGHVSGPNGGFSITGGYVYRGCAYPELQGTYFFADFVSNNVWSFRFDGTSISEFTNRNAQITPSIDGFVVNQIASFGEDANGELYIVDHGSATTGQIFKIIPATGEVTCPTPCPADLNGDGSVDAADLAVLLGAWGSPKGDVNGDGTTDAADLAVVLGSWGPC
jgi:glucose/arabinose dehydrogenase